MGAGEIKKSKERKELRAQGLKYREIADVVGVSFQYVAVVCGKGDFSRFRSVKTNECVYVGLRNWMNENMVSKTELLRRIGLSTCSENNKNLGMIMRGKKDITKKWIDKVISATGLSYEVLFKTEE